MIDGWTADNLISREALKEHIKNAFKYNFNGYDALLVNEIYEFIDNAPTVSLQDIYQEGHYDGHLEGYTKAINEERPQGEWIPVSERLPSDRDWYLGVFREADTGFIGLPYICDYAGTVTIWTTKEGWILRGFTDIDKAIDYVRSLECVAWQPLPEPYKEADNETG